MPPILLVGLAFGAFAAAAAIGAALLLAHKSGRFVPFTAAGLHGLFAVTGLILLAAGVWTGSARVEGALGPWPTIALILFLAVAAGGIVMVVFHIKYKHVPLVVAYIHGAGASLGLVLLALILLTRSYTSGPVPLDPTEVEAVGDLPDGAPGVPAGPPMGPTTQPPVAVPPQ